MLIRLILHLSCVVLYLLTFTLFQVSKLTYVLYKLCYLLSQPVFPTPPKTLSESEKQELWVKAYLHLLKTSNSDELYKLLKLSKRYSQHDNS